MIDLKMYCLSIDDKSYKNIKKLNYIPVGLGNFNFTNNWVRDNTGDNISYKNEYYGEYTFHYWYWKNFLNNNKNQDSNWVGFCAQRRFWSKDKNKKVINNLNDLKLNTLQTIPSEWEGYDAIIGDEINVTNIPWIKIIKYGKSALIKNPKSFFKKKRNIKFQFDMFHGCGLIDKAIKILPSEDQRDFKEYINKKNSFNQGNMFICKSKSIMNNYYNSVFSWLLNCEKIFGFELQGYGKKRIYAFLAERYLPYWFSKYTNKLEWPVLFYDLTKDTNEK